MKRRRFRDSLGATLAFATLAGVLVGQAGGTAPELAEKVRALRQKHAATLVEIGTKCRASDQLFAAVTIARTNAMLLDPAIGEGLALPSLPAMPGDRGADWMAIDEVIGGIRDGVPLDPDSVARIAKLALPLAELAVAQAAAAAELKGVVVGYRALGEDAAAFEVAELCYSLHRHTILDEHRALSGIVAEQRYEAVAKVQMEEFRRRHEKVGKSKGWKLKGMFITAPKPNASDAAIIARAELSGDRELSVDAQFAAMHGKIVLVAAWNDSQNYCGLEYDRATYWMLSLIHVEDGERKVLATSLRSRKTWDEFFALRVRIAGNRISTDLGIAQCEAELPEAFREGARYGLLRPGFDHKPSKEEAMQAIVLRNLVVK